MTGKALFLVVALLCAAPYTIVEGRSTGGPPSQGAFQVVDLVVIEVVEESVSLDVSVEGPPLVPVRWSATLNPALGKFVDSVDVHMTPQYPSEIDVGLSIYDFSLKPSEPTVNGEAYISAAPGTSASRNPTLVLDATAKVQPRGTAAGVTPDSLTVNILPFYSTEAHFSETAVTLKVGERRTFELTIENMGNSAGDFRVQITNVGDLAEVGIEAAVSEPTVNIGEGQSRKVDVVVKVKEGATVGGHSLLLKVTPVETRNGNVEGSALLTIDVREAYMSAVQSVLGEPLYMLGAFALLVLLVGALTFCGLKLRSHIQWKRTLGRIRSRGGDRERS